MNRKVLILVEPSLGQSCQLVLELAMMQEPAPVVLICQPPNQDPYLDHLMDQPLNLILALPEPDLMDRELKLEEKDVVGLRVYVKGGGCHGYQYGMAFESKMAD